MPDQLLRSAYIASEGPLVLDGETLIGIIVKDTYVFSTAHENASEVTAYEVEPVSTESRLTGTCAVVLNDAETAWLPLVTGTTAVDLSDVEDRGGIVWVRPGASDAVRKIIGWAADPGPGDAAYLPTWPDGLYAELIAPFDAMSADSTVAGVPFVDGDVDAEDLAAALAAFIGSGGTTAQSIDKTGETPGVVNIDLSTGADAVADDVAVVAIMGPSGGDCEFVVTPPVRSNGLALGIYAYCPGHFATITIPASGPLDEVSYGPVVVPVVELVNGALAQTPASGGGGAVDSVNGQTGVVVLDADDIGDGTTNKAYTATEKTKLAGIATGATANQSDATTNAAIAAKASKVSITGATKTKVTYNADGIVTGGADATTADIADSSDKRYVTDAQQTVIGNTSGTNTGDQTLPTLSSLGAVPTSRTLAGLDLSADRTASALRTALGLVIGTDVLAPNGSGASLTGIPESAVTNLVTDLAAKAPLASPTFTGTPAAPTAAAGTATTQVATTGFAVAASMFRPTAKIAPSYYAPIGTTVGSVTSPFSAAGVLGAAPIYLWAGSYIEVGNSFYYGTGTATIRIGLYDSTGTAGLAGSLVSGGDFGTISCVAGSFGAKSISISLTLATSGWYWIAGLCDAFTSAPDFSGYRNTDCSGPTMVPGFPHSGNTNRPSCILRTGVTTGSMPSTFGTPTNYQGTNFPAFRIYLNS